MAPRRQESIYRFDSPCGEYCYIGKANTLAGRIGQHGSATGDSAIARHCRECQECNRVRRSEVQWRASFTALGSATGNKQIRELETTYIEEVCENFIRDPRKPFPLNEKVEIGSGTLLVAAKTIHKERKELEKERSRSRSLQSSLGSAELDRANLRRKRDSARHERDELRQERDGLRREWGSLRREQYIDRQELNQLREKHVTLEERWNREKDSIRAGKVATTLYRVGPVALFAILLLLLVGLLNSDTRASFGRIGPALSLLVNGTPQAAVAPATTTRTPIPIVTLQPSATPPATRTKLPTATPPSTSTRTNRPSTTLRSTTTSTATLTPQPTTTPSPTATPSRTPNPSPTPRLLNALFDGVRVRTCPRKDERDCGILGRLSDHRGTKLTVLGETQGRTARGFHAVVPRCSAKRHR